MIVFLAVPALFASAVLAHGGPNRLDNSPHKRQDLSSSVLSRFRTAVSSAAAVTGGSSSAASSATGTSSSSDSTDGREDYLPLIIAAASGSDCLNEADQVTRAIAGCIAVNREDDVKAVACACGLTVLNITETAAQCIVSDAGDTNGTAPLHAATPTTTLLPSSTSGSSSTSPTSQTSTGSSHSENSSSIDASSSPDAPATSPAVAAASETPASGASQLSATAGAFLLAVGLLIVLG
ncbi:hypothetical protein JCM11641_008267 [Rhodosporidiobolus odoratus]